MSNCDYLYLPDTQQECDDLDDSINEVLEITDKALETEDKDFEHLNNLVTDEDLYDSEHGTELRRSIKVVFVNLLYMMVLTTGLKCYDRVEFDSTEAITEERL